MSDNPFLHFIQTYRDDPVRFVREVLKIEPDPWQQQFLRWIAAGERRISIRSAHGVGKSTAASWGALWFLLTRYPVKVVITAPTSSQLYDALFAELKHWVNELPEALRVLLESKNERVVLKADPDAAFVSARTSRAEQPEALQGVHSEHVMLIADEASGVPEAVFEAASGSMSGYSATTVLLGNPTKTSGLFFETHHRLASSWKTMRVSAFDSPRVSEEFIEEMKLKYGEESNAYRVRVLGEFPKRDDDTIIPLALVDGAQNRDVAASPTAKEVWGLDVARFGSDASALCRRRANVVPAPIRVWKGLDTMQLVGAAKAEYDACAPDDRPEEILVDAIGLGAGVADRLRELGLPARAVNVSESPGLKDTYINLRAELWYQALAWLQALDCKLPKDDHLFGELTAVKYKFTSSGKLQVESKEDMKRRGLASPNRADALILTFAGAAATATFGTAAAGGWNQPLRRRIPGQV